MEVTSSQSLRAELTWIDGRFVPGWEVKIQGGRIVHCGPSDQPINLVGKALMPGMVNAHSHAFQRVIRGRVQGVPVADPTADFWSWREQMYAAATALSPEGFQVVTRLAYIEMLKAGFTSVAEFHYVHHEPDGRPYPDPAELSWSVLAASDEVGIRCCLLPVAYARAGFGLAPNPRQRRFLHSSPEEFLALVDKVIAGPPPDLATVGVALHSIRAVPRAWLGEIARAARARGVPLHLHVSEQTGEIEQSLAEYGARPVQVLAEEGVLGPSTTLVHAIHLSPEEEALIQRSGATVCACPTTERDLGDGILPAASLHGVGVPLALGTDSHVQIDPFAEMRALEGHERLRARRRCLLLDSGRDGDPSREVAPALLRMATAGGARAIGRPVGEIAPGRSADLVALDLGDSRLIGADAASLPAALVFSADSRVVRDVMVGGRWVVTGGQHAMEARARRDYLRVLGELGAA